jgi:AraC-like DNA-binding protein
MLLIDITSVLIAMGLGQSLLFFLLAARQRSLPGRFWLCAFHLAASALMLAILINNVLKHQANPMLVAMLVMIFLSLGPLLLLYALSVTGKRLSLQSPQVWLHLTPWIALELMTAIGFLPVDPAPANETAWFIEHYQAPTGWGDNIEWLIIGAYLIAYMLRVTFILRRHVAMLKTQFSAIEHQSFEWLSRMVYALMIFLILFVALQTYASFFGDTSLILAPLIWAMAYLALVSFSVVNGLHQQQMHSDGGILLGSGDISREQNAALGMTNVVVANFSEAIGEDVAAVKYSKSTLTAAQATDIKHQLEALMASEHCFLENNLTLVALANSLAVSPHNLSQVLNESMQTSFYDYVNKLRVEEVARCLRDPAYCSQTVLEIAFASGFSSKTTFNTVFKRVTGLTPTSYRSNPPSYTFERAV